MANSPMDPALFLGPSYPGAPGAGQNPWFMGNSNPAWDPTNPINDPNNPQSPWHYPGQAPDFNQVFDPSTQSLASDTSGYDAFKKNAMRTGPSTWANLANSQQATLANQAKSDAASAVGGRTAQAESDLAMHGGMDSGARERITRSANQDFMNQTQNVNKTQANNSMQIGMNDEQNRISQLGQVQGMYNETLQPAEFNTQASMQNEMAKNTYNMGKYQTQMGGWAAGQQAYGQAHSGKK